MEKWAVAMKPYGAKHDYEVFSNNVFEGDNARQLAANRMEELTRDKIYWNFDLCLKQLSPRVRDTL